MRPTLKDIIIRALIYYKRSYVSLVLVIALVSAIITASLLAGYSVRHTLSENSIKRLNGAGIMISSGIRNTDASLAQIISVENDVRTAPILMLNSQVKNFTDGKSIRDVQLIGADSSFYKLGGGDLLSLPEKGEAVINYKVAEALGLSVGDNLIVRFKEPSDIPSNAPFAPGEEDEGSLFLTVKYITNDDPYTIFNPGISQVIPFNLFVNINEFSRFFEGKVKCNRILIEHSDDTDQVALEKSLKQLTVPGGIGLRIRRSEATGTLEIISDRIFIDATVVSAITEAIDDAEPLITYLANSIESEKGSTPYSFVSAISNPDGDYPLVYGAVLINRWLANDLQCVVGDSILLKYYVTGTGNELIEESVSLLVAAIVEAKGIWADSLLMPSFPGITGSRSCTQWDAGIPLDMDRIREKDEDYWNNFAGRPKAFITYKQGTDLWGNQFGPATAIRFPGVESEKALTDSLKGIDGLGGYGLTITDIREEGLRAATSGVDFSTLFLSLSFFIIISSILLLVMILDNHLHEREGEVRSLIAMGFAPRKLNTMFLSEAIVPVLLGAVVGMLAGIAFNAALVKALNSVWIGAVQTDTIIAKTSSSGLIIGGISTVVIALSTIRIILGRFIKRFSLSIRNYKVPHQSKGRVTFVLVTIATLIPFILLFATDIDRTILHFIGGTLLLAFSIIGSGKLVTAYSRRGKNSRSPLLSSARYYTFFHTRFLSPVLFIAAALFVVITTGANRRDFSGEYLRTSSGTGGFSHWIETTTPVNDVLAATDIDLPEGFTFMHCLRVDGDDASCLNLNHITSPHILGVDASLLAVCGSFSFATIIKEPSEDDKWNLLLREPGENSIYGFLDQSVMQWGMKIKAGDTVTIRSESGTPLHIIVAGGLKASVFQGYLVVDKSIFRKYFPSVSGSNIILAQGESAHPDSLVQILNSAFEPFGGIVETTTARLSSFNRVTNTYLSVFMILGGLGMILGVMGLGLNLTRNIRSRRKELALLTATGFTSGKLRKMLFREQFIILITGIICGALPGIVATIPSLTTGNGLPLLIIGILVALMLLSGVIATLIAVNTLTKESVVTALRRD